MELFDQVLLGVIALSLVFGAFVMFRWLFRSLFRKQKVSLAPVEGDISSYRDLLGLAQAEKGSFDRQISHFNETFKHLLDAYQQKKSEGAQADEINSRLYSFTIALRNAYMQLTAMLSTFLVFEHVKTLLVLYTNLGIDGRSPGAPRAGEIAKKLNVIKARIIAPLLTFQNKFAPDPNKYFFELTIPEPQIIHSIDVVDSELRDLYETISSYLDRFYNQG